MTSEDIMETSVIEPKHPMSMREIGVQVRNGVDFWSHIKYFFIVLSIRC